MELSGTVQNKRGQARTHKTCYVYELEKEFAFMVSFTDILAVKFNNLSNVADIAYDGKKACQSIKEEAICSHQ